MRDILMRDAAILVTARMAKDVEIPVEAYLDRYSETTIEREEIKDFLVLMEMINQTWRPKSQWSNDWSLDDRGDYVWVWSE